MKTKEEIEQLAESEYGTEIGSIRGSNPYDLEKDRKNGFIKGYTQCQEDMSKISEWQLCPKCFGEGEVSNVGTSSSIYRICPVCNGNKTLIKPIIR
jgi:hypothetical protein